MNAKFCESLARKGTAPGRTLSEAGEGFEPDEADELFGIDLASSVALVLSVSLGMAYKTIITRQTVTWSFVTTFADTISGSQGHILRRKITRVGLGAPDQEGWRYVGQVQSDFQMFN